jgi:hypothetical protein
MPPLTGRYSAFPGTAVIVAGLGILMLAAAAKFIFVDHFYEPLPYLFGFFGFCVAYVALCYAWVGTFELGEDGRFVGRRRVGGPFRFAFAPGEIVRAERCGTKKAGTLGVRFDLTRGRTVRLRRIRPEARIDELVRAFAPR